METDKLVRYFGSTSEQILTWSWRAGILFLWCWSLNLCANKLSIHAQNFKGLFLQIVTPWTMHTVSLLCHLRSRNGTSLIHPWSHFSRWETYWFFSWSFLLLHPCPLFPVWAPPQVQQFWLEDVIQMTGLPELGVCFFLSLGLGNGRLTQKDV